MAESLQPAGDDPAGRRARLRWGGERRIRRRPDFKRVYENGRRIRGRGLTLFCLPGSAGETGAADRPSRLGITVTRAAGGSVTRNRIRRRIREFFRVNQREIAGGWDVVVNALPGLNKSSPGELAAELRKVLAKAGLQAVRE